MKQPMINTMKVEKFDTLYTPFTAMTPLIKHLYINKDKVGNGLIWECCDSGGSLITSRLTEYNSYKVISTDIETGFDFLKDTPKFSFDMIITNPPYSQKDQFLEKCYSYKKPFALLLPLTALEGVKRGQLFRKYGISVIILDKRTDFTGKAKPWFNASWFVSGIFNGNELIFEEV